MIISFFPSHNRMIEVMEAVLAGLLLVVATGVATGYLNTPYGLLHSPYTIAILIIASLVAFGLSPVVGLSAFLLLAVLFFRRNVQKTITTLRSSSSNSSYGDMSIPEQHVKTIPFLTKHSEPRPYPEFNETNPSNPELGQVENFEPAPFGDELGAPVGGQYPIFNERVEDKPFPVDYEYKPGEDTGSNSFERFGPDIDEKKKVFTY